MKNLNRSEDLNLFINLIINQPSIKKQATIIMIKSSLVEIFIFQSRVFFQTLGTVGYVCIQMFAVTANH